MTDSFSSLGVPAELATCLATLGVADPYPIQTATLPDGLAGKDLFAQSPTGSGKTLAFAIPMVARISHGRAKSPRGLVLAPTRELAAQIAETIHPLAKAAGRRVAVAYGGTGYGPQLAALRSGVDILVGCPGRLIDLLERGALRLGEVEVVVVDEADRMADMGFLPAVRRLVDETPVNRQTMLFAATINRDVDRLVRDYQRSPARHLQALPSHEVGSRRHEFWRSTREGRAALTAGLVAAHGSSIVFCRTKHGADRLAKQLSSSGFVAVAIHGDRSQPQRDHALALFRERRAQVLVGTDVASRGLHVDGVDCVIHFDPPGDDDTYVHRSGRTGRAGASGLVISLITSDQERDAIQLARRLGVGSGLSTPPADVTAAAGAVAATAARRAASMPPQAAALPASQGAQRFGRRAGSPGHRPGGPAPRTGQRAGSSAGSPNRDARGGRAVDDRERRARTGDAHERRRHAADDHQQRPAAGERSDARPRAGAIRGTARPSRRSGAR